MKITNHTNANFFNVIDPTTEATAEAKKLVAGKWAKITPAGIIVHKNFRAKFEALLRTEVRNTTIAPTFQTADEKDRWLDENLNSAKAALFYSTDGGCIVKKFNARFAGMTVTELEKYALED